MKLNKFFIAAAAATMLFSCSKEQGTENPVAGQDTYAGISVSFPKMVTGRAVTSDPNATAAEQVVTSVGVYVVDNNSGAMHSKVFTGSEFQAGTGTGNYPNTELYYLTTALKTTTGEKSIYVVLNPTATVEAEIAAKRGTAFSTASIAADETAFVNGTTDMVMSGSAASMVTLGVVDATAALAAPVAITVQRNTAKVAVTYNSTVTGGTFSLAGSTGTASDLQFAMITTAKNSYLVQQLAAGQTVVSVANVRTPGYSVEPLATNAYWSTVAAPATYKAVTVSTTANTALAGFYVLENVNATNLVGNTTAAIIKAKIAPADGKVVTGYNTTDGTRTLGNYVAGEDFYVKKSDNTVWSEAAYDAAIVTGGDMSLTAAHFSKPYVAGESYYRIWVQNDSGVKGVLRNNYYVMQVNSISGFGSPTVPGVDPEDPTKPEDPKKPIDEDAYISVSISVKAWEVIPSGHDL